jgi:putative membrane protein
MMGFGFMGMSLFWGVLLILLVGAVALISRPARPRATYVRADRQTASQVLRERLARGEIDLEEYDAIRARME